jgi:hypothetical protein
MKVHRSFGRRGRGIAGAASVPISDKEIMHDWRLLDEGEIILETDEYYDEDKKIWRKPLCIGSKALDPRHTSNGLYRRFSK